MAVCSTHVSIRPLCTLHAICRRIASSQLGAFQRSYNRQQCGCLCDIISVYSHTLFGIYRIRTWYSIAIHCKLLVQFFFFAKARILSDVKKNSSHAMPRLVNLQTRSDGHSEISGEVAVKAKVYFNCDN